MNYAVIFDVDGVLLDSVPLHFAAWKRMFEEEGATFSFEDYLAKVNGIPRTHGIQAILPNKNKDEHLELAERKQKYFLDLVASDPPKPLTGVVDLLSYLKENNIPTAAASSSKNASKLLEKAGLTPYFLAIVGGNDFSKPKPDPELFLVAAKKLSIDPKQCVVIEDATTGILAAKAANMKAIGILTSNDQSLKNYADIVIPSFENKELVLKFLSETFAN